MQLKSALDIKICITPNPNAVQQSVLQTVLGNLHSFTYPWSKERAVLSWKMIALIPLCTGRELARFFEHFSDEKPGPVSKLDSQPAAGNAKPIGGSVLDVQSITSYKSVEVNFAVDTIEKIKITILFWWKVLGEILRSVMSAGPLVNNIPAIMTVLLVSILSGVGISKTDIAKITWTEITGQQPGTWLAVVTAALVYVAINLLYQPANMYKKLGGFIDQPFKIMSRPRVNDNRPPNQPRSGSITVENTLPKKTLKDCVLTIESIKDSDGTEMLYSQQRRVSWSSGLRSDPADSKRINQEIDIRPKIPAVADLFETRNDNTFIPTTWSPHPPLPVGTYDVRIIAHGRLDGVDVNEEITFVVEYAGGNSITIAEKKVKNKKR